MTPRRRAINWTAYIGAAVGVLGLLYTMGTNYQARQEVARAAHQKEVEDLRRELAVVGTRVLTIELKDEYMHGTYVVPTGR